jgi:hypothetical protein
MNTSKVKLYSGFYLLGFPALKGLEKESLTNRETFKGQAVGTCILAGSN